MRVALLGAANSVHLQRWAAGLAGRGHALCVISQHRVERALLPAAAEVVWLPHAGSRGYFLNAFALRRTLARWEPEILNAHYASGYGTTAALAGFRPTLLSVWGSDVYEFPYQGVMQRRLLRWNLRRATALASTSRAMADQVRRLVPGCAETLVTPFGVDLAQFVPDASRRDPATLTIGIVKSLAPKYGVDLLLRAFASLRDDPALSLHRDALRLLVVGDGPQHSELEALAGALGIASCTEFAGAVEHAEVSAWLNRLDVYVAPSRQESFGVAVIEAGACALPVVVSDAGGLPEVVVDGVTGLVVPCDDVPALQAALKRLVVDPALRSEFGRRGREHVAECYEWGRCVDTMEHCYERTIAQAGSQAP